MTNDDLHDDFQDADPFSDLSDSLEESADVQPVDEFAGFDSFTDMSDDLILNADGSSEAALPEVDASESAAISEEVAVTGESESAAISEEIAVADESESAAVSEELLEVGACTRILISPSPKTIVAGEQIAFTVEAFDKDDNPVTPPDVKWTAKGGDITKAGVYTAGRAKGVYSVKAFTKGITDRIEGEIEAAPTRNEWALAAFFSAAGIYLALALTFFLDRDVFAKSSNFIGYFNFDWAIATILVGPCVICFISSALGMLSKPKGKEWLLLLPSLGPLVPVIIGAIAIMSLLAL